MKKSRLGAHLYFVVFSWTSNCLELVQSFFFARPAQVGVPDGSARDR